MSIAPGHRMTEDQRRRELAAIHIAVNDLQLGRTEYVSIVREVSGKLGTPVDSSKDLDARGRGALLDELRRLGASTLGRAPKRQRDPAEIERLMANAPRDARDEIKPMVRKIAALLADARRGWDYAHGLADKMFLVKRVEWLRPDQMRRMIAALSIDQRRREARGRIA